MTVIDPLPLTYKSREITEPYRESTFTVFTQTPGNPTMSEGDFKSRGSRVVAT